MMKCPLSLCNAKKQLILARYTTSFFFGGEPIDTGFSKRKKEKYLSINCGA
jgi:hypothetical protein